jgi:hypothetical protein
VKDDFINKDLTRRNLLRVAGLAGLGAVAVPLLNACSTKGNVGTAGASASASVTQTPAKSLNFLCWLHGQEFCGRIYRQVRYSNKVDLHRIQ